MNTQNTSGQPYQLPVFDHKGQLVADSRDVAEALDRQHEQFMRIIRAYCGYLSQCEMDPAKFFIEAKYTDEQGKPHPNYLLTETGCEFVAKAEATSSRKVTLFRAQYAKAFHAVRGAGKRFT